MGLLQQGYGFDQYIVKHEKGTRMKKYQLVLFDIDGTIADTSEGVINCVKYTEYKMNLPPLDADTYKKFIGPPNREAYGRYYGLTESRLSRAIEFHKAYALDKGIFEAKLYPGIRSILDCLKRREILMAAATLKQQEAAEKMLRYLGDRKSTRLNSSHA